MRGRGIPIAAVLLVGVLALLFWRLLGETRTQLAEGERTQLHTAFVDASRGLSRDLERAQQTLRALAGSPALAELLDALGSDRPVPLGVYGRLDGELRELVTPESIQALRVVAPDGRALIGVTPHGPPPGPATQPEPPAVLARAIDSRGSVVYDLTPDRRLLAAATVVKGGTATVLVELRADEALRLWSQAAQGGDWALLDAQGHPLAAGDEAQAEALAALDAPPGETRVRGDQIVTAMPLERTRWSLRAAVPTRVAGEVVRELGGILVLATVVVLLLLVIGMGASEAGARLTYVQRSLAETERQEKFLQAMFDAITDVLIVIDPELQVVRANRVARQRYGAQLVGRGYAEALARRSQDHPRDVEAVQRVFESGEPHRGEITSPQGDAVWAVARFPIFKDGGAVQSVVEVAQDVSRERLLQAQLVQSEKLSTLGEMAAGIAHEINNPLGVVSMFAQLLEEEIKETLGAEAKALETVRTIEEQTANVGEIVKNLLRFARKSGGEKAELDVNVAIDRALGIAEHQKEHKALEVVRATQTDPPPRILGEEAQLAQVVLNLIVNARHAMQGAGTLTIRVSRRGPGGADPPGRAFGEVPRAEQRILLAVGDTGSGIAPEVIDRLFEPFFTTKPVGEGTGLGLSVSFGIVRDHGGCMWVDSEPGRGTTFTLDLPAV